jgi:hypothetical protein
MLLHRSTTSNDPTAELRAHGAIWLLFSVRTPVGHYDLSKPKAAAPRRIHQAFVSQNAFKMFA